MREKKKSKRKERKISFLIPVHNEEKILDKTLDNLSKLPYKDYEVILGLDGCDDKSENIVEKYKKKKPGIFQYYLLNERKGKPFVIDKIIKHAKGEIIIINDADWIFSVKNKESLEKFLSVFDNEKIGGIVEEFPVEWQEEKIEKGNLGYKMVAYSSFFWLKFQKEKFTYKKNNLLYLKTPTMFLTNIFRKKLYEKNFSLGDDFERTKNIMNKGYDIIVIRDDVRMLAVYNKISLKDLFKQKIRTAIAREQIKEQQKVGLKNYYLEAMSYLFREAWKESFNIGLVVSFWLLFTISATIIAKFKTKDTKEGWKMRIRR